MSVMNSSTVLTIIPGDDQNINNVVASSLREKINAMFIKRIQHCYSLLSLGRENIYSARNLLHSIKVGIALALVSLLYLVDPLYEQVGENAMWAIMTVVVVFEFFAGATLSKGLNRTMGTIVGGGLGCLAATLAQEIGGTGRAIAAGTSVFIFGAGATYYRSIPAIKKRYDYGTMIFILTFNLVAVSGLRSEEVLALARERLSTIVIGFGVAILTSLLIFPIWASDELHNSTVAKFSILALSIEGCMDQYLKTFNGKDDDEISSTSDSCKKVLNSKANDEMLANFAKWEPWHGKFGFYHPWDKYLCIGELLRELAASMLSLRGCLQSPLQTLLTPQQRFLAKEPCEAVAMILACTLREFGESINRMRKSRPRALAISKVQIIRLEISEAMSSASVTENAHHDELEISTFVVLLMEMMNKVEQLAKEVEELGDLAGFLPHQ
ncbi:hypothetical protein Syun_007586 [Stephania yunnanensis]|uniref:Aluminum-activated malate transporter n=1 Tax=Stephania yunnanensis TaxID=152371 RepID=A0AAP0PZG6_9MAGN